MLTAMAVLALLLAMIFGVVESASKLADSSQRGGDSDIEARQVLDRIGMDIAGMVIRSDVDQLYSINAGNDTMFFYTQQAGYGVPSPDQANPVTLVGYRVHTDPNPKIAGSTEPILERLAYGLSWDGAAGSLPMSFLTFPPKTSPTNYAPASGGAIAVQWASEVGSGTYDNGASPYYDKIGSQIFRMKICFQSQNGTFSQYPGYTNSMPSSSTSITNTTAVVVAIAVLDTKSRQLVPEGNWPALIGALPDPAAKDLANTPPVLMDSIWNTALTNAAFAKDVGIPEAAASHIKVYQRYYYLNAPKAQ
jgi:hypothetical protein